MKLILQAIKSLLNKINIRLREFEDKISDENIADGKFLPDGTPYFAMKPYFFQAKAIPTETESLFAVATKIELTEGNTYTVTYNGVEYVSECVYIDNENTGLKGLCLGNTSFFGNPDTGEPFMILASSVQQGGAWGLVMSFDGSTSVTFSIAGESGKVYKLDERLLPDSYQAPMTFTAKIDEDSKSFTLHETYDFKSVLDANEKGRDIIIWASTYDNRKHLIALRLMYRRGSYLFFEGSDIEYGRKYSLKWYYSSIDLTMYDIKRRTVTVKDSYGKDIDITVDTITEAL